SSTTAKGLCLAGCRKLVKRPLRGALAGSKRKRQRRARPRGAVGKEGEYRRMLIFDRQGQHDEVAAMAGDQRKPPLGGGEAGKRAQRRTRPPDFAAQPCGMGSAEKRRRVAK